jgi:hypothetical protein
MMMRRWTLSLMMVLAWLFLLSANPLGWQTAAQESGGTLAGTWYVQNPLLGGVNRQWYTFGADGSWSNVSLIQGGMKNGQEIQRWGFYKSRMVGPNQYQVVVQIQGGAPQKICAQGQGCTGVNVQLSTMQLAFTVQGQQMRQSDGTVFQRAQVPQQLAQRMPDVFYQRPLPNVTGRIPNSTKNPNGMPNGVGGNCDDAQQAQVCHMNDGHLYRDSRGCQVCAAP